VSEDGLLVVGDLALAENSHEVLRGGEEIRLTATEFELLRYLMLKPASGAAESSDPRSGVTVRLRR